MTGRQFVAPPYGLPPHIQTLAPADLDTGGAPDRSTSPTKDPHMRISEYLDCDLRPFARVRDLEAKANRVAERPLDEAIADLREVLKERQLNNADHQRLHVLLSQMYHRHHQLGTTQVTELRGEVTTAWELSRSRAALQSSREE